MFLSAKNPIVCFLALSALYSCNHDQPHVITFEEDASALPIEVYERAEAFLPENIGKIVFGQSVLPQWRENGAQFWFEAQSIDGFEYVLVDPDAGERRLLVDRNAVGALVSDLTGEPYDPKSFRLNKFQYDFETTEISFEAAGKKWIYNPDADNLTEKPAPPAGPPPGLSPDGKWRVFVDDHDLYIEETASGATRRLTHDGTAMRPYARPLPNQSLMFAQQTSDPKIDAAISWAPDSSRFASFQMDLEGATRLSLIESSPEGGGDEIVYDYIYPLAGDEPVPSAQRFVFVAATGKRTDIDLPPLHIRNFRPPRFQWTKDSRELTILDIERGFHSIRLFLVDAQTGVARPLTEATSKSSINAYSYSERYLENLNAVLWTSDESGRRHAHLVGLDGSKTALTNGDWNFNDLIGATPGRQAFFITGSGREPDRDPYLLHLYRIEQIGESPILLTPEPLHHDVSLSPGGRYFVDNMSLANQPTRSVLRSAEDGEILMELQRADISKLEAMNYTLPEPFETVAADGQTPIYGVIYRPANFDPSKRYRVIDNVYTGPHHVMAAKSFSAALPQYNKLGGHAASIAQLGFIVIQIDGRGTAGRSKKFLEPAYGNLHGVGLDDHIAGIKALAETYPYMDITDGVGVFGLSAGGFDAMRAMLRYPEFYTVGVSAAGNHDNRLNQAYWSELFQGYPVDENYIRNSNPYWADKLKGKVFLAHGELDESVPPIATSRLVDALIMANKDFEYLIIPGAHHYLDANPYFVRRRWDFFTRELLGMEPPKEYEIGAREAG